MLTKLINLAFVDENTLFRTILKKYIAEQKNMNVVIHSPHIEDLLIKLKDFPVHVLVMDVFRLDPDGVDAVRIIKSRYPNVKILVLTMCNDMNLLSDLLDAGIYGIISKTDEPEELLHAITCVSEDKIYRNKLFTEVLYWSKQNNMAPESGNGQVSLNNRENEILQMLWQEKSNREIADYLYLSVRSVEKIRQNLKEKAGVKSTIGLLKFGINKKIIKINFPWEVREPDLMIVG